MCSSIEAGGSAIFAWLWRNCVEMAVCSTSCYLFLSVMVTSHCWPFLHNYPCYLSNWHCLSLALTVEVSNAWCARWWTRFLSLCSCVFVLVFFQFYFVVLPKLIGENVLFFFLVVFKRWAVRPNSWSVFLYLHTAFPSFFFLLFYAPVKWHDFFFFKKYPKLIFSPEQYNNKCKAHLSCDQCIFLIWRNMPSGADLTVKAEVKRIFVGSVIQTVLWSVKFHHRTRSFFQCDFASKSFIRVRRRALWRAMFRQSPGVVSAMIM